MNESNYVVGGMAAEGRIRAVAATTRQMVEEARERHDTSPVVTAALSRLLTGAAMMGLQMKETAGKLTLTVRGDGPVKTLTAVADAEGNVKGYAGEPQAIAHSTNGKLNVAGVVGKGELTVVLKQMGKLSAEERPVIGQLANEVRAKLEAAIESRAQQLANEAMAARLREFAQD